MSGHALEIDFRRPVVCVLGLPFDAVGTDEAAQRVRDAARRRSPLLIATANVNFVIAARDDERFRHSVIHSHLSIADGMPIVWISRLLGLPMPERVPGSGLFERLCEQQVDEPLRVYFYGGPEGAAAAACERVNASATGVVCVGYESPGYRPLDELCNDETARRINDCEPDFVLVALGARKGQAWIERMHGSLEAPVITHLGAVVNYAAGTLQRAPTLLQRCGLEWAWRVFEEPQLWRRYAGDAATLGRLLVAHVLPLWWSGWRHSRRAPQAGPVASGALSVTGSFDMRLGRVCTLREIDSVVGVLERAAQARSRVSVDLSGTEYIDAAVMARLLMLHGWQRDIREPLVFHSASPALRRLFRRFQTAFLLDSPPPPLPTSIGGVVEVDAA